MLIGVVALMLTLAPNVMVFANTAASHLAPRPVPIIDLSVFADDTPDFGSVPDGPPPVVGAINLNLTGVLPTTDGRSLPPSPRVQRWPWAVAQIPPGSPTPRLKRPPKG